MDAVRIVWQLVIADFRERTRRYSYLITLMAALFLGYLVLTGKYSYHFGVFKPVYNSAWVGTTVAMAGAVMFSFVGFFIVRTSISRDRVTRVGEILLTTRLSGVAYLCAKFASNLLVFWSMVGALALTALVAMLVRIPLTELNLTAFFMPFLVFPMVLGFTVAAAAVLFDTVRWLRGVAGNIIYFIFAQYMLAAGLLHVPYVDAAGIGQMELSIKSAIGSVYPGEEIPMAMGFVFGQKAIAATQQKVFLWSGMDWSQTLVLSRLVWPAIALVLLLVAIFLFDRFEQPVKSFKATADEPATGERSAASVSRTPTIAYRSIRTIVPQNRLWSLVMAELQLGLKDTNRFWLIIGLGLIVSQWLVPFEIARKFLVPGAMIWPIALWSAIGARPTLFDTRSLLFSAPGVHSRQFAALVGAGIVIAVTMCAPTLVRAAIDGEFAYVALLATSVLLIPTTALALGIVSGSRKFFEVVYPLIWYGGSIDTVKPIDLLGTSVESVGRTRMVVFLVIALVSVITAWFFRRRSARD